MRSLIILITLLATAANAFAFSDDQLMTGVGDGDYAYLSTLLEATIFSVDVAEIEAFLAPDEAEAIGEIIKQNSTVKDSQGEIRTILLNSNPAVLKMSFLRNTSWESLMEGIKDNMHGAVKSGVISEKDFENIYHEMLVKFSPLETRGVKKGDNLFYRVSGNKVHIIYLGEKNEVLIEFQNSGPARVKSLLGSFFSKGSEFSEGLIKSLDKN